MAVCLHTTGRRQFADTLFEEALVTRLYESLAAGDGVYKITRLVDSPHWMSRSLLTARHASRTPGLLSFMTWQLEWHYVARTASSAFPGPLVEFHASDYFDQLYLVSPSGSGWTVTFDANGRPLQLSSERFVLSAYRKEPPGFSSIDSSSRLSGRGCCRAPSSSSAVSRSMARPKGSGLSGCSIESVSKKRIARDQRSLCTVMMPSHRVPSAATLSES